MPAVSAPSLQVLHEPEVGNGGAGAAEAGYEFGDVADFSVGDFGADVGREMAGAILPVVFPEDSGGGVAVSELTVARVEEARLVPALEKPNPILLACRKVAFMMKFANSL